jgi:hypothetical protein
MASILPAPRLRSQGLAGQPLHSVCGYRSPIDYEHDHRANSALELAA